MANEISKHVDAVTAPGVASWLRVAATAFAEIAEKRNHLLHARPATVDGKQMLYRRRAKADAVEAFVISHDWLDGTLAGLDRHRRSLDELRPAG